MQGLLAYILVLTGKIVSTQVNFNCLVVFLEREKESFSLFIYSVFTL